MRRLLFLVFFALPTLVPAQAPGSRLMKCLAMQEAQFHRRKAAGAFFELNQRLIAELVQVSGVEAAPALLSTVCRSRDQGALHLLEALLLDPKGWFVMKAQTSALGAPLARELVRELNATAPEILLTFLSQLQMQAPTPDCLERHVPGLAQLYQNVKWLQEEVDLEKITNKQRQLAALFAKIHTVDEIYRRCAQEKAKNTATGAAKPSAQ